MFRFLTSVTLIAFLSTASANALIIDTFDISQALVANAGKPTNFGTVGGAGIIGGERDAGVGWLGGAQDVQLVANAGIPGNGLLSFSVGADTFGEAGLVWDGSPPDGGTSFVPPPPGFIIPINPTGLGGVDLTEQGAHDRIAVNVAFADWPVNLWLAVFTDANNWSWASIKTDGGITTPTQYEVLYASFDEVMGKGPADFTNVGAIALGITDQLPATDVQIDFVDTKVPEPATLSLLALGGLVLLRRRRR